MVYYLQSGLQQNTIKHLYGLMENVLDEEGNIIGQKEADDISKDISSDMHWMKMGI